MPQCAGISAYIPHSYLTISNIFILNIRENALTAINFAFLYLYEYKKGFLGCLVNQIWSTHE